MNSDDFFSLEHPIRFAHRGSTILWPENTMTALQGAVSHSCRYIESDLHMTRDGIIVLFHDHTLDRLTNGRGKINQWYWKDLCRLDAAYHFQPERDYPLRGHGITIPSLEEVVTTFPDLRFNLDLKQPGMEKILAAFIRKHRLFHRVLLTSFSDFRKWRFLKLAQTASSAGTLEVTANWIWTGLGGRAIKTRTAAWQVPVKKLGCPVVSRKLLEAARRSGIQVHVWTINEPAEMKNLLQMGVDGIITDRIDLLNGVLNQ